MRSQKFNRAMRRSWHKLTGGRQTARDLVNSLYGATLCTAKPSIPRSIRIYFPFQLMPMIPRMSASTVFAVNGIAIPAARDIAWSSILAK